MNDTVLVEAYEWAVEQEYSVKDLLLREDVAEALVLAVTARSS